MRTRERVSGWLEDNGTDICGLFSFQGRITPLKDIEVVGSTAGQRCAIKEVLPSKLYRSEVDTKGGLEYFINEDGTFSHFFS
jgi:hypothetical protein